MVNDTGSNRALGNTSTAAGDYPGSYHPNVVELFNRLPFAGRMEKGPGVFSGAAGAQNKGTEVRFWIKCNGDRIAAISYQVFGCPHTIAVAAWVAFHSRGLALMDIASRNWLDVERVLAIPPEKRGRLLIVEDALRAAAKEAAENV